MKRAALLVLVAALAGCGSTRHRPIPTKAAFAAAADRICATAATRSARIARLHGLRAPAGGEDLFHRWLEAEDDALSAVTPPSKPPGPDDTDPGVLLAIAQGKIAGYSRRLGAEGCARGATGTLPP